MANEFLIRIRADDAASATIKKIEASFARVTGPLEKAQSRVSKLGAIGQSSMETFHRGLSRVSNAARTAADSISSMVPGMAALTGAASIAGIVALSDRFANMGFNLNKSSGLIGESRQSLQAWHIAASRAGVSAEEMNAGIVGMQSAIRGAAQGANPEAMTLLTKMGVQIAKNKDGTVDYAKTQERVLEALRRQKSVQGQRAAAMGLGAGSLLPMIQRGTWEQDRKDALESGLIQSDAALDRAQQMQERINRFKERINQVALTIGDRLVPVLQPVVEAFNQWFTKNQEEIARGLSEAIGSFVTWIKALNWSEINKNMKSFWDTIGGIKGVAVGLAIITFAGPAAGLISIIASLIKIGTLLAGPAISTFFGLPGAIAAGGAGLLLAADAAAVAAAGYVAYKTGEYFLNSDRANHAANPGLRDSSLKSRRTFDTPAGASSGFGSRTDPITGARSFHTGIDYPAPAGSPIFATKSGRVLRAGDRNDGYGNMVELEHEDGTHSRYAHASKILVAQDQIVRAGEEIAQVGSSGRSTGNHVHYEVLLNGKSIDPSLASNGAQANPLINFAGRSSDNGAPPAVQSGARTDSASPPPINITVNNAQPGTRVDVKGPEGFSLPTKVNYSLGDMGAMP